MTKQKRSVASGTGVTITTGRRTYTGVVAKATNWFDLETDIENWFVEFVHNTPGLEGRRGYWKQSEDGGQVEFEERRTA